MKVDFYLLKNNNINACPLLACRILEKAYKRGHRVFVYCEDLESTNLLDELLWTYKDESFIPHNIQGEGPEPPPVIQIGYNDDPRGYNDILLNMANEIPVFYKKFTRIIEIVADDEKAKEISRQHFREYKKQGFDLKTHTIDD
jgi:DNA polymerase III subunit chi